MFINIDFWTRGILVVSIFEKSGEYEGERKSAIYLSSEKTLSKYPLHHMDGHYTAYRQNCTTKDTNYFELFFSIGYVICYNLFLLFFKGFKGKL